MFSFHICLSKSASRHHSPLSVFPHVVAFDMKKQPMEKTFLPHPLFSSIFPQKKLSKTFKTNATAGLPDGLFSNQKSQFG
jgi:hypothetical protein